MSDAAFWAWSLKFYEDPAVADACLALQDGYNADVNIVLVLLWLAAQGAAPLVPDEIRRLDAAVASWRSEVVVPLRTLRRALKGRGHDAVRKPVAAAELEAEQSAQRLLVEALPPHQPGQGSARLCADVSLRCYGKEFPPETVNLLLDRLETR